jgi:hypothetical protein
MMHDSLLNFHSGFFRHPAGIVYIRYRVLLKYRLNIGWLVGYMRESATALNIIAKKHQIILRRNI